MIRSWLAAFLVVLGTAGTQITLPPAGATQAQSATAAPVLSGPEQPVPFSHKVHAGAVKLPCETCHTLSKSGQSLTIPQSPTCMLCHQTIATDKPGVQKLATFAKAGQLIPWVRIYQTPSFVTFSHKMHLDHNNTCQECHGQVAERDQLAKEADISMTGCVNCHQVKNAATGCDTCHTLEQSSLRELQRQGKDVGYSHPGKSISSVRSSIWDVPLL
jgi:hypothetical protein